MNWGIDLSAQCQADSSTNNALTRATFGIWLLVIGALETNYQRCKIISWTIVFCRNTPFGIWLLILGASYSNEIASLLYLFLYSTGDSPVVRLKMDRNALLSE